MVPTVVLPPCTPPAYQVTPVFDKPVTWAEYWAVWPTTIEGSAGVTVMLWENTTLADAAVSSAKPRALNIGKILRMVPIRCGRRRRLFSVHEIKIFRVV